MILYWKRIFKILFVLGIACTTACFFPGTLHYAQAAGSTARIHVLALNSDSNAVLLETVDQNGNKIFGMVDSGEDWDYPDGSNSRYPFRSGITTAYGYDDEVLSYLNSVGVTKNNLIFYVATHPHSDHIGTADTIIRRYAPKRVYALPYQDSYVTNKARLWDNLYVYDQLLSAVKETNGVQLIQRLNPNASTPEQGNPAFSFGNFYIQIVNYDLDYMSHPKDDANQFCLGVIATANQHQAFLTSDIVSSDGDADRIVSQYGLSHLAFMTSNHHGSPDAVSLDYLKTLHPQYFIETGFFHTMSSSMLSTLSSMGSKVYSTVGYSSEISAIVTDFSGSQVTCNLDNTYHIYDDCSSEFRAYYNGLPCSGLLSYNGNNYYAKEGGILYRSTTWLDTASGISYTFDASGRITKSQTAAGWVKQNGKWYYYDSSHTPCTGWLQVNGKTYYMDQNGVMVTGWLYLDGKYYWFASSGEQQYGWQWIKNNWYYLDLDTGVMYSSGWHVDPSDGKMYYFYNWGGIARNTTLKLDGYSVSFLSWGGVSGSSWIRMNGRWYYIRNFTCYNKGWLKLGSRWYFFNDTGSMRSNVSFTYQDHLYFVNENGAMYQNQWLLWNGFYYALTSSGAARKSQWYLYKNTWYYLNDDSSMQTGWSTIHGKTYYFRSDGGMVTGTVTISGKTYQFNADGALEGV